MKLSQQENEKKLMDDSEDVWRIRGNLFLNPCELYKVSEAFQCDTK